jgi:YegS/Rv2252/BmrU family lipid kinase
MQTSTPTAKVIVNPYAGRWKAQAQIPQVRAALDHHRVAYNLLVTEAAGEGIEIAKTAAQAGFSPIVAVGGDSTISEVINGLITAAGESPTVPMGIIPLGTANDLAYALGLPVEIEPATALIARGQTRIVDAGRVNGRHFGNNSAVGLEPVISQQNDRLVRVKGTIRYLLAALICIMRQPQWTMTLEWDDGRYEGSVLLVSVGNTRRTGGVFFMTPEAKMDDGRLDFVFAPSMSRLKTLRLLPMTFNGSHVQRPEVTYLRTTRLQITCHPGTPIQADGEVFETDTTKILYEVLPNKLTVIV